VNVYRPHRLASLFGGQESQIVVGPSCLKVYQKDGSSVTFHWPDLDCVPVVSSGLLFSRLSIASGGQRRNIWWLSKKDAAGVTEQVGQFLYKHHAQRARKAVTNIETAVGRAGYLRSSFCSKASLYANKEMASILVPPDNASLPGEVREPFTKLQRWASAEPALIEDAREQFLRIELHKYREQFATIEANPLTDRQREACVIDEDSNLVLAGAGTGKTSTMVGRAAYLIESGRAADTDILMLAFGKKAAEEMRERVGERIPGSAVQAATFHSLGKNIIASVEGAQPRINPLAEDERLFAKTVDDWFQALLGDPAYRAKAVKYFARHLYPEKNCFDFKSEGEYFDYIRANEIRSLKGEQVKSYEECLIANWLFCMGVEYQYEATYSAADTRTADFRAYLPDFYLPEHDVYIEHFGIDRDSNTAPYVDRQDYHDGIQWKRALHQANQTTLLETYSYEQQEGRLLESLEQKLEELGIRPDPLPDQAVLETIREVGVISRFSTLLSQLAAAYKASNETLDALRVRASRCESPAQFEAAMDLLAPIVDHYEELLGSTQTIDFNDMIGKAIAYVESGQFVPPWRFLLVDEFQDISRPRARLIKALRDKAKDCSIFCVGDDWQAIYRFTGSDVSLTTGFVEEFGPMKTTALDKTFRFNNQISEVASEFVMRNPAQVRKTITTHEQVSEPAVSLLRRRKQKKDDFSDIHEVLTALAVRAQPGSTVYLLARFWFQLPDRAQLRRIQNRFPHLEITTLGFHSSKGKEADYVVITGLDVGPYGFPSTKTSHPLLEALLPLAEPYDHAEERRLFYVALTRARHRAYLICDMASASPFVTELLDDDYHVELNEFETDPGQLSAADLKCQRCETGTMVARQKGSSTFYGCANYPLCNHTDQGCPTCGQALSKEGRYKVCISVDCGSWVPLCPECNGSMTKRAGRYGEFWGCSNYRRSSPSCTHKERSISAP